jgi:ABC-type branched-subunit amino acid transport system ATPase component
MKSASLRVFARCGNALRWRAQSPKTQNHLCYALFPQLHLEKQDSLSAEMQALSQEMSMISNALNNMIKLIGEANTTLARKS